MIEPPFGPGDKVTVRFPHSVMPGVVVFMCVDKDGKPMRLGQNFRYRVDVAPEGKPCVGAFALSGNMTLIERFDTEGL
jgi:hypothetical protein